MNGTIPHFIDSYVKIGSIVCNASQMVVFGFDEQKIAVVENFFIYKISTQKAFAVEVFFSFMECSSIQYPYSLCFKFEHLQVDNS
uniref:Uncharacterized protein n=1 Tax=Strongyloides papillosus TaxID=174720 RepID=A0A0N5C218_STREA